MTETTVPREPMTKANEAVADDAPVFYCANHPHIETLLRCNKCGKPICMKCAVQTPVGYRCRECVRQQQDVYFNAESWDNPIALAVAYVVTVIALPLSAVILGRTGFFGILIALFVGASAGGILAQVIRWAVRRRRGRYLPYFALSGIILGILSVGLFLGFGVLLSIPTLIFTFLAISTAYPMLR